MVFVSLCVCVLRISIYKNLSLSTSSRMLTCVRLGLPAHLSVTLMSAAAGREGGGEIGGEKAYTEEDAAQP